MKSILSIQDLSCVGRCSLTVALPVLSSMGCRCSVLPTAVLSTHTGFPDPHVVSLTEHIGPMADHFDAIGAEFDAVTVGYLSNAAQAEAVLPVLKRLRSRGSLIIADPAMGDHGKLYRGLGKDHVAAMAAICREADVILPNVTEAALLTGLSYREQPDAKWLQQLVQALPAPAAVITGVSGRDGTIGFCGKDQTFFSYSTPVIPRQFHGTGDLFCAVFAGRRVQGASVYDAAVAAADFVKRCVAGTETVTPYGVAFEKYLSDLMR